jgi:hypothetical protein
MKYIIILFLFLILVILFFNKMESFQDIMLINKLEGNQNATINNINKLVKIPNSTYNGFLMNGVNSYITIEKFDKSIFSISMLINTKNSNKSQVLIDFKDLIIGINNNKFYINYSDKILEQEFVVKPNFYYHVVITYNNQLNFFVNGFLKTIESAELSINEIFVGMDKELNNAFYGIIGGIQIFNEELNRDQICEIHNKCVAKTDESEKVESEISDYKKMFKEFTDLGKKCEYKPRGETMLACKDRCNSVDKQKWGGDKCTEEKCEEICKDCDDIEVCRWIQESKEMTDFLKKPKPFFIKGYALDSKIKITWINASQPDIIDYYMSISEKDKPSLRVNFISKSDNGLNEFTIINLKNNIQYEISLYGRNKFGVGQSSNIIRIIPKVDSVDENNVSDKNLDDSTGLTPLYKSNGDIDVSKKNMDNNEYQNVLNFVTAQNDMADNEYNLDINFK